MKFAIIFLTAFAVSIAGFFIGYRLNGERPSDDQVALISLTKTVKLEPVPIPMHINETKVGHCIVTAQISLPLSYTDDDYLNALSKVADRLIKDISAVKVGTDAEEYCLNHKPSFGANSQISVQDIEFYPVS